MRPPIRWRLRRQSGLLKTPLQSALRPLRASRPDNPNAGCRRDRSAVLRQSWSWAYSTQSEEGKDGEDHHDQSDKVNKLVHVELLLNGLEGRLDPAVATRSDCPNSPDHRQTRAMNAAVLATSPSFVFSRHPNASA